MASNQGQRPDSDATALASGAHEPQSGNVLNRIGYACLLLLALALPFETTQQPLLRTHYLTLTNLKLLQYALVAVAVPTLIPVARAWFAGVAWRAGREHAAVPRVGLPGPAGIGANGGASPGWHRIAWLAGLCLACLLSSLRAHDRLAGLKWTFDLALAGLLWLAIPLWLERRAERIDRLALAIVAGAVASALIGLGEFAFGPRFAQSLTLFKTKPTLAGSYLRLSATFEYANIAAMFFELTLFLALAALLAALCAPKLEWGRLVALLLGTLVLLEALLLTYSRGALLGMALGLSAFAWLARNNRTIRSLPTPRRRLGWLVVVPALALCAVTAAGGPLSALRANDGSDQDWYRATYAAPLPRILSACERLRVRVTVANRGPLTWWAAGDDRYRLGYHWLLPSGQIALFEGLRTPLPRDLGPSRELTLGASLLTPSRAGRYLLVWDMVEEGVTWFSLKSARYEGSPVTVANATPRPCAAPGARAQPAPSSLPTVQSQPPRSRLWAAALAMLRRHPLLGVGPDGFRLAYGIYTTPPQASWDQRILANSLYLEVLADLGLAGAACFLAAVVLGARHMRFRFARRDSLSPATIGIIAALVALLGHGLVDYSLQSHALFLLCWILCGMLAASSDCQLRVASEGA